MPIFSAVWRRDSGVVSVSMVSPATLLEYAPAAKSRSFEGCFGTAFIVGEIHIAATCGEEGWIERVRLLQ